MPVTAAVVLDIIDGFSGRLTRRGWEYDRIARVTNLTATGHARAEEAVAALAAHTESVQIGSQHPTSGGTYCEEIVPEHESTDIMTLRLVYRPPEDNDGAPSEVEDFVIQVGTTLEQAQVNTDSTGEPITVEYDGKTQGCMVSIGVPKSSAVIESVEAVSPADLSRDYVGKVNSVGWAVDGSAEARTWRCDSIVGTSTDRGETFKVRREYSYDPDTFDQRVVYIDPDTGRPPSDVVEGTGAKKVQVYEEVDLQGSL